MSDLDAVLERLLTDSAFAHELSRNPTMALAGYELSGEDLSTLSTQVSFDRGEGGLVEERISKSSTFGLLSTMAGGLSGLGGDATGLGGPDTTPGGVGVENPTTVGNPNEAPGVIDPNQAPGAAQSAVDTFMPAAGEEKGAVDWFMPAGGEEGPEETVAAVDTFTPAPVEEGPEETIAAVDTFTPAPVEEGPEETIAAVDTFTPAPVEEGPEESVFHEVDKQPAQDVGYHEVDQPATGVGLADPGVRVGFNPQPDPPGLPG